MRCAILVAPLDPRSSDVERRRLGSSRVADSLESLGFRVVRVEDTSTLEGDFARAMNDVPTDDEVLVHVSGQLAQRGVLRVAGGRWLPLSDLGRVLHARERRRVTLVAELEHEDEDHRGVGHALAAADHTEAALAGFGARDRGYDAITVLRSASRPADAFAFTQLLLDAALHVEDGDIDLASAYERVLASPASRAAADNATFVRGAAELRPETPRSPASLEDPPADGRAEDGGAANAAGSGFAEGAPSHRDDPLDPATHADAFARATAEGHLDAAYLAALALEELGALDADQRALVGQFRSVTPVRARETLDAAAWDLLRVPTGNQALAELLRVVARSAMAVRLEQLVERRRLVVLDPVGRLDEASTASVVRSFQWSARVLGTVCPALHVAPEVPGEIAAVRAREPTTAVGPSVVSGRSAKELAFLAGRHLTYYLPEHHVVVYYPTEDDLSQLVLAATRLARRVPATTPGAPGAAALSARLAHALHDAERTTLAGAVSHLRAGSETIDLTAWARGVELTAARAGLFLCGDLATAMAQLRSESRSIAGLTFEEKRTDLIAFCASTGHAALRARFAMTEAQWGPASDPPRSTERPGMPPDWHAGGPYGR